MGESVRDWIGKVNWDKESQVKCRRCLPRARGSRLIKENKLITPSIMFLCFLTQDATWPDASSPAAMPFLPRCTVSPGTTSQKKASLPCCLHGVFCHSKKTHSWYSTETHEGLRMSRGQAKETVNMAVEEAGIGGHCIIHFQQVRDFPSRNVRTKVQPFPCVGLFESWKRHWHLLWPLSFCHCRNTFASGSGCGHSCCHPPPPSLPSSSPSHFPSISPS